MPDRTNPVDYSHLQVTLGTDEVSRRSILSKLIEDGLRADRARAGWLERQRALTKLRYSWRRPNRTFPFPGASNIGIPYIDGVIRSYKPLLIRLLTQSDPVVEFVGEDSAAAESERDAEELYNWLFKLEMNAVEPMAYVVDSMAHRGFSFGQVGWDYKTEYECRVVPRGDFLPRGQQFTAEQIAQLLAQQYDVDLSRPAVAERLLRAADQLAAGAEYAKLAIRRVVRDRPAIWDRDAVSVITPARTTDVGQAEWIIIQHVISLRQVQQMEADGHLRPGAAAAIQRTLGDDRVSDSGPASGVSGTDQERALRDELERIWGLEDEDNVLLWQIYHWADLDNDGLADRTETWTHPRSLAWLGSRAYAMPFPRWPLVRFDFEKTNRRWHAPRGISTMLEGIQRAINAQHNARIDGMTIRNAPTYQMPLLGGFRARNFRVTPGTILMTPPGAGITPIGHDRGPFPEQVAEEQNLRQIGESYIGTFDAVLQNQAGGARTATEIQTATQFAASTAQLDAELFQLSMRELHEMVWQLFMDLAPPEISFQVLGRAGPQPAHKIVSKADVNKRFRLVPTGTLTNTNRALELAHAREAMQIYLNDQSGFINPFELRLWHMNLLTRRWARRIVNSPDQARELTTLRQAAAELQQNTELQAALTGGVNQVPPAEAERQRVEFLPRARRTEQL